MVGRAQGCTTAPFFSAQSTNPSGAFFAPATFAAVTFLSFPCHVPQIGKPQIRAADVCIVELRPGQIASPQIDIRHIGGLKRGIFKIALPEIREMQIGIREIRGLQIAAPQVRGAEVRPQ